MYLRKKLRFENRLRKHLNLLKKINILDEFEQDICIKNLEILALEYGFTNTLLHKACLDSKNKPIPWYTYPAIDYIKQLDFSDKDVFEYGCGNSSLFWASIAKSVTSVDENPDWVKEINKKQITNLNIKLYQNDGDYINSILNENKKFDVVIIDGNFNRYSCAVNAVKQVKDGGLIILDNSDRAEDLEEYSNASKYLRENGLIQVDMSGFGPLNPYTWTTSFFFHRNFNFSPKFNNIQPKKSIGNI